VPLCALAATPPAIGATPPKLASVTVQGDPVVGTTLAAVVVATGDPAPAITYHWRRCLALQPSHCDDIKDAISATYVVPTAMLGYRLVVKVNVKNSAGTVEGESPPTAVVVAPRPAPDPPPPDTAPPPSPTPTPTPTPTPAPSPTPTSPPGSTAPATQLAPLPLLRWHPVDGARYYNVQLFRGGKKILSAWPAQPRFQLQKSWRFHGHRYRLTRGRYRWYAWPGFGARAAGHYGRLIRAGTFYFKP
jgi:hypothetical protein